MEEGCFSSPRSSRTVEQNEHNQKIALGLKYPIYIITASYYSPYLNEIRKRLQKENITLAFQNSLEKIQKIPMTHRRKFFIILNDFKQTPHLDGDFQKMACEVVEFPKIPLQKILSFYRSFIKKQQTLNSSQNLDPKQCQIIFLHEQQNKQNIQSSDSITNNSSKIQVRRISKITRNYKTNFPAKLFIYKNSHDDQFFLDCCKNTQKYHIQNRVYIARIEEYLHFLPDKEDVRFLVLMSQYSALNLRKFFKKCDQIIVCTMTPQNCVPLLRAKVGQIICDAKALNQMLTKNFDVKQKRQSHLLKEGIKTQLDHEQVKDQTAKSSYSQNLAKQSKTSSVSLSSSQNLKITQQYSLVSQARKQLNMTSSIIDLVISPTKISNPFIKNKIASNATFISPGKIEPESVCSSPLKIVQLQHINLAQCNNTFSEISVFTEVINTHDNNHEKGKKIKMEVSNIDPEMSNLMQNESQYFNQSQNSQESRTSQRSNRNSRIIQRFRENGKKKSRI